MLTGFAVLALLLSVGVITLSLGNRTTQNEVNTRQQFINQSIKLSQFNSQLIQELAAVSAQTGDKQIRNLLLTHGITFTANKK